MSTIKIADKPTLDTVSTNVTAVKNAVQDSTYGLQAIKTSIDNIGGGALVPTILARNSISSQYSLSFTPTSAQKSTYKYFTACVCNTGSNGFKRLYIDSSSTSVPCDLSTGPADFVFTSYIALSADYTTDASMIVYGWK